MWKLPQENEELQNNNLSSKSNEFDSILISELSKYSQTEQCDIIPFLLRFISQLKNSIESSTKYNKKKKG